MTTQLKPIKKFTNRDVRHVLREAGFTDYDPSGKHDVPDAPGFRVEDAPYIDGSAVYHHRDDADAPDVETLERWRDALTRAGYDARIENLLVDWGPEPFVYVSKTYSLDAGNNMVVDRLGEFARVVMRNERFPRYELVIQEFGPHGSPEEMVQRALSDGLVRHFASEEGIELVAS